MLGTNNEWMVVRSIIDANYSVDKEKLTTLMKTHDFSKMPNASIALVAGTKLDPEFVKHDPSAFETFLKTANISKFSEDQLSKFASFAKLLSQVLPMNLARAS